MRPPLEAATALAEAHLGRAGLRPVVVAHDIWLAAGLQRALPSTALACISASDAVAAHRARGTEVFCLAEEIGPAATAGMSSLDLVRHEATAGFFARLGPNAVIAFKPSERIAEAVTALGGRLLAAPSSAARAYENKLAFIAAAERAGVPRPRWKAQRLPPDVAELQADLGPVVVVQGARGNAGQRTWMVRDQAGLDAVREREGGSVVRVGEYIEGVPFTASGVGFSAPGTGLDRHRVAAAVEPCRQVTGVSWLTPEGLGSCGNAWGDEGVASQETEVTRCVRALAADLSACNYHGIFGVDFVLAADGPLVIEVNPRMIASLPVATELEVEAGRAPLLLLHLLEMLGADLEAVADETATRPVGPATQVILHRLPGDADEPPPGGVYRVAPGEFPVLIRPGGSLEDLTAGAEMLLVARSAGEPVTAGKEFARIYCRSPLGEDAPGLRDLVTYARKAPH